jgi:predicted phage-related endonuclease
VNAQQIGKIIQAAHGPLIDEAKFRAEHVGASEVAALFDCSPYLTCFELWHRKAGNISTPAFPSTACPTATASAGIPTGA